MSSALAAVPTEAGGREPPRHFLELMDFEPATLAAHARPRARRPSAAPSRRSRWPGSTVALIFEKPSTRTRVSFEVGIRQLGGDVVMLYARDMQSSRGEAVSDTAQGAVALRGRDHDAHRTTCGASARWRSTRRCPSSTA